MIAALCSRSQRLLRRTVNHYRTAKSLGGLTAVALAFRRLTCTNGKLKGKAKSRLRPRGTEWRGGGWRDAAADSSISQLTTQPSKHFLYGICAGRRIDPGGFSVGGTIPDSWLPQVCRVADPKLRSITARGASRFADRAGCVGVPDLTDPPGVLFVATVAHRTPKDSAPKLERVTSWQSRVCHDAT